ncbi:MAG: phosphate uptake regulator PhoU [bacterium]|nr:phosphate uptake regulator PhoU [bacterium]
MLDWLFRSKGSGGGVVKMTRDLERMIQEGRHAFDTACSALIGGAGPDSVRKDLLETDKRIDKLEQSIRRQIVVHASVHGAQQIPEMMVLMSVAKDAERIGDYAKNIFSLTANHIASSGKPHHDDLQELREQVSTLLADAPDVYDQQDKPRADVFINRASELIDACEAHMTEIFSLEQCSGYDAVCALAFRHIRRVAGHVQNIITAVVNPIDRIDFHDEPSVPE